MRIEVTTWYLEMLDPSQLNFSPPGDYELRIEQARIPSPELSRFLYSSVGGDWYWLDRLKWNYDQWMRYLDRPELETWVAYLSGTPAGFIELEAQNNRNVKVNYFGLLRAFIGKRLGGHLLSVGVERAWAMGAQRVWLHTCSLDGPNALNNYKARGFKVYKSVVRVETLPDRPPGPWEGAY